MSTHHHHNGDDAARTVREIVAWVIANKPPGADKSDKERRRVLGIFALAHGEMPLHELRTYHLLNFVNSHSGCKSGWTKRRWATTIRAAFNYAARLGFIPYCPLVALGIRAGGQGRDWTKEEMQLLLRHSSPYFRRVVLFLRFTGCRPGEVKKLKWEHVDFKRSIIVLQEHKMAYKTSTPRTIYLSPVALKLLKWLHRHRGDPEANRAWIGGRKGHRIQRDGKLVMKLALQPTVQGVNKEYVFTTAYGTPWRHQAMTKRLRFLRMRSGLSKEVRMHGGRHTFITNALANGVDIATVATLVGHSQIGTTMRYTHLVDKTDAMLKAATRAVQANGAG
jgi:integrase